jgi:hypothetical protein
MEVAILLEGLSLIVVHKPRGFELARAGHVACLIPLLDERVLVSEPEEQVVESITVGSGCD